MSSYAPEEYEQKKLAAALAHPSKPIRDKTCATLTKYIRKNKLKDLEVLRLWKALHQCLWLTDKQVVQLELANFFSGLLNHCVDDEAMLDFFTAFWRIIMKEWGTLDQFRVNKFYSLMRMMVHEAFKLLFARSWPDDLSVQMVEIMENEVIYKRPNGPRFHIADIILTELYKVTDGDCSHEVVELVLSPFFHIIATDSDTILRTRISDAVFHKYLQNHAHELAKMNGEVEGQYFSRASTQLLQKTLFALASSTEHNLGKNNRKNLYDLHEAFQRVTGVQFVEGEGDIERLERTPGKRNEASKQVAQNAYSDGKEHTRGKGAGKNSKGEKRKSVLEADGANETFESTQLDEKKNRKKTKTTENTEKEASTKLSPKNRDNSSSTSKELPIFIKSKRFAGYKQGYVFKNDGKGNIGYHLDSHQTPPSSSEGSEDSNDASPSKGDRRVSFGRNRSKEYSASVKGLKESVHTPMETRSRRGVLKRK